MFLKIIRNKAFLTALLALIQTLVLHFLHVDPAIWASIDGVLVVVISIFATEDLATRVVSGIRELRKDGSL